jgi:hypothetical protein
MNDIITDEIERIIFEQSDIDNVIKLIKTRKIPLSVILKASHVFCKDCCDLYTPCHIGEWIRYNPELYDSEIGYFVDILNLCSDNIAVDIIPYSDKEVNTYYHVSEVSDYDKLRQLYTLVLNF